MLRALAPYLAYAYLTFVKWTTRLRVVGAEHPQQMRRQGRHYILAFWHNRQVFFTTTHRHQGFSVMVSMSRDGGVIAKVMSLSGIHASRGSSSRGGAAGVREMAAVIERGGDLAISPDGPKGPVYEVKPGVLFLAQKLSIPIIPITNALSRKIVFKRSWDQFQVPLPFGRAVLGYGEPIWVREGDDMEEAARRVKAGMDRNTQEAERAVA
ncbi:MAG: lysophospholipid acyltransferase family protein [Elusimicrobia bacterium]|nr:lysophospholipid acyltransferase family protein [Elusimicrobiota bacterium]